MFTLYAIIVTALAIIIAFTDYSERFASNGQQTTVYGTAQQLKAFRKASMILGHAIRNLNLAIAAKPKLFNAPLNWHINRDSILLSDYLDTISQLRKAKHDARLAQIEALLEYNGYYAQHPTIT